MLKQLNMIPIFKPQHFLDHEKDIWNMALCEFEKALLAADIPCDDCMTCFDIIKELKYK